MDINQLRTFTIIAREGQMTRAAQILHLTQPALSAQLAKLEDELGTILFDRTPRGMTLTAPGALFLTYVEDALSRLDDGERALKELRGLQQGSLSVGGGATATTYLLPAMLARFHESHPGLRLFVREQASSGVIEAVLSGELDLGVVTLGAKDRVPEPLASKPWVEDELVLLVPPGHALEGRGTYRWKDLDQLPLVLFEAGSAVRNLIDARLQAEGCRPHIVMELRSIETIKQMVAEGIGAGFVSRIALSNPSDGLRATKHAIKRQLAVVWRMDRTLSPAAKAFVDLLE
jgi:DNA-binding transcriptional LysR family regulator